MTLFSNREKIARYFNGDFFAAGLLMNGGKKIYINKQTKKNTQT
jgi:hypothetical protein